MPLKKFVPVINYIKEEWKNPIFFPKNKGIVIGLPNSFISPNKKIFNNDQFYWDTYFIIIGLLDLNRIKLAKGMVDNLIYLYNKYKIIPSRNRVYNLGVSQPPFLTSMIFEVFKKTHDKKWLKKGMLVAESELNNYWKERESAQHHLITLNLSRYCDHNVTHVTAEHESGWDMTSRFKDACMHYLPVDLNSCLYKYEIDLAKAFRLLGDENKAEKYQRIAEKRKFDMLRLMWSEERGFFFDYNYVSQKRSKFYSLAGFYPIWAGLAEEGMAKKMVKNLKFFEFKYGLANTQSGGLSKEYKQWDYPNAWSNQQFIVSEGLKKYGYFSDANRIQKKWVELNTIVFKKTKKLWEKYNVIKNSVGNSGRYPTQQGFGWTNGVFIRFLKELGEIDS